MDMVLDGKHRRRGVNGGLAAMAPDEVVMFGGSGTFGVRGKSCARIVDKLGVSESASVGYYGVEFVLQGVR
jgi:hypothetical protein